MSTAVTIADVELVHAHHAAALDAANRRQQWLDRITTPQAIDSLLTQADHDEIDELMQLDPYAGDPPSKRSDKETDRLLSILDALDERGNG
jgi:hypothetical protein